MSIFYVIAALIFIFAGAFVIVPWLKASRGDKRFEVTNVNVIKQRIAEIEQEAQEGLIEPQEMQNAIDEMKIALVDESPTAQFDVKQQSNTLPLAVGMALAVIVGVWVYWDGHQLNGLQQSVAAKQNIQELSERIVLKPASDVTAEEFNQYALIIRQRLKEDPQDATGWQWLGRLRMTLGQLEESVAAFQKALEITPSDNAVRVNLAEVLMMSGDDESLSNAMAQMRYLVSLEPENRQYRLLLTVIAAQSLDTQTAFSNFALIKNDLSPQSSFYASLVEQLRAMGASEEILARDDGDNADSGDDGAGEVMGFEIAVNIAPTLANRLPEQGVLIVFAQDAQSDSKMPLAVKKVSLPAFPYQLRLTVDDAMLPGMTLANTEQVHLTARISLDENVAIAAGELQGRLEGIQVLPTMQQVSIDIDEELQ